MVVKRAPRYKTFSDKRYERVGSAYTKNKKLATAWADFQRKVNNLAARVIHVPYGYEIYVRRGK
jgi:hypothetical protein